MKSPNHRAISRDTFWDQVDSIIRTASPSYQQELIKCYHLQKFKPGAWKKLSPATQMAAHKLWWRKYLPTPEGEAYLDNCFSEPLYPRDPILDGPPAKKRKASNSETKGTCSNASVSPNQIVLVEIKEAKTKVRKDAVAGHTFKKQLKFIGDSQSELF